MIVTHSAGSQKYSSKLQTVNYGPITNKGSEMSEMLKIYNKQTARDTIKSK